MIRYSWPWVIVHSGMVLGHCALRDGLGFLVWLYSAVSRKLENRTGSGVHYGGKSTLRIKRTLDGKRMIELRWRDAEPLKRNEKYAVKHADGVWRVLQVRARKDRVIYGEGVDMAWPEWQDVPIAPAQEPDS